MARSNGGVVRRIAPLCGVVALAATAVVVVSTAPSAVAATPVVCNNDGIIVRSDNGTDPSTVQRLTVNADNTISYTTVGQLTKVINAVGYNSNDGLLYGTAKVNDHFYKFGEDTGAGEVDLGQPINNTGGAPVAVGDMVAAAVTDDNVHLGFLSVGAGASAAFQLVRTNLAVSPLRSTFVPLSLGTGVPSPFNPLDVSFNPYNGLLYTLLSGKIYSIDPTLNPAPVAVVATTPVATTPATSAGGSWTDSFGNLFFYQNQGSTAGKKLFKLNPTTNELTAVAPAVQVNQFDATACLPPALSKTVSPGTAVLGDTLTFTFQISNPSSGTQTARNFTDTLPAGSGLSWVPGSVSPASPGGGTVTLTASTLTIDPISIPKAANGARVFTAQAKVVNNPANGAGTYVNRATVTYNGTAINSDDPFVSGSNDGTAFTVRQAPSAGNDTATTAQDVTVSIPVTTNDTADNATLDKSSVRLVDSGGALVTTLSVLNQGTYTVDTATGAIAFDPLPTFTGPATAQTYSVADSNGDRATATVTPSVTAAPNPSASPDTGSGAYNTPVTVYPTGNDNAGATNAAFDPATVRIVDPATSQPATTVTVPHEGTYAVDQTTGGVTFTPLASFTGPATAVTYRAATTFGKSVTSTIAMTTGSPSAPTSTDDTATTPHGHVVTVSPLINDNAGPTGTSFDRSTLRLVDPANNTRVTTLTVTGQGTYAVDTTAGTVTFTPDAAYTGSSTPSVAYEVHTNTGAITGANLTVTVLPNPTADADSVSTPYGQGITVTPLSNDHRGNPAAGFDPATLTLLDAGGNPATVVTVTGKGTFTVNADGTVRFEPVAGFTGSAAVPYSVRDTDNNAASSTITVAVSTPPAGVADIVTANQNTPVSVVPTADDTRGGRNAAIVATSTRLVDPVSNTLVTSVSVIGQGTWSVDTSTGTVTFTPDAAFTGTSSPVTYAAADADNVSYRSTITATISAVTPTAAADSLTGSRGRTVSINPLANDAPGPGGPALVPASLRFPVGGQPGNSTRAPDGLTLTVAGVGVYTANADGTITLAPTSTFVGPAPTITYSVADGNGTIATSTVATTLLDPPAVTTDAAGTTAGVAVTVNVLANDHAANGTSLDPSSVIFPTTGQPSGSTRSANGKELTVTGQGVYSVNAGGTISFAPAPGYTGTASAITYAVSDQLGGTGATTLTVSVSGAPTGQPDTARTPVNTATTVDVVANDIVDPAIGFDRTTVIFPVSGQPANAVRAGDGRMLTVPHQGTYQIDAVSGDITFTPAAGFDGPADPVTYRVADHRGGIATATLTVEVGSNPAAVNDSATTPHNATVVVMVLANDTAGPGSTLQPTTVTFPVTGQPVGAAVQPGGQQLTITGCGVYTVNGDGSVTFNPDSSFSGTAPAIAYQVADQLGRTDQATITVIVRQPVVAVADTASTSTGTTTTVNVIANDTSDPQAPLAPTSVVFPTSGQPAGAQVPAGGKTLTVIGQGEYHIDLATGAITFVPEPAFVGPASPVTYSVADGDGTRASATLSITVTAVTPPPPNPPPGTGSAATPDRAATAAGTAVTVPVVANDVAGPGTSFRLASLRFATHGQPAGSAVSTDGRTLTVPGQGTYTAAPDGTVTFTPDPAFAGPAAPVAYEIEDATGAVTAGTLVVTVGSGPKAHTDAATAPVGQPVTFSPLTNDAPVAGAPFVPSSLRLSSAGITPPSSLSTDGRTLTVDGVGTFVAHSDGTVTFTPVAGFIGDTPAVAYSVADSNGMLTGSAFAIHVDAGSASNPPSDDPPTSPTTPVDGASSDGAAPAGAGSSPVGGPGNNGAGVDSAGQRAGRGGLALTGSPVADLAGLGAGLLAVGWALFLLGRRRKATPRHR